MAGAGEPIAFAAEVSPSRRLLARLRDVMAASGAGASRLDKIVRLIAAEMGADGYGKDAAEAVLAAKEIVGV